MDRKISISFTSSSGGVYLPTSSPAQTARLVSPKFSTTHRRNTSSSWTRCRRLSRSARSPTQTFKKRLRNMKLQQWEMLSLRSLSVSFIEKMGTWTMSTLSSLNSVTRYTNIMIHSLYDTIFCTYLLGYVDSVSHWRRWQRLSRPTCHQ